MNLEFRPAAQALLSAAGWSPERRLDTTRTVADLSAVGFTGFDAASDFLARFGQLRIEHDPSLVIGDRLVRSSTDFSPERVCTQRDAAVAELCSVLVGEKLFPVAVDSFHMTVYLAESEKFYAGLDASVYAYADDLAELLDNMLTGTRPRRLADWG